MFKKRSKKEIDINLLKQDLIETLLGVWLDGSTLSLKQFSKSKQFKSMIEADNQIEIRFAREKLRFLCAVLIIALKKLQIGNDAIHESVQQVMKEISKAEEMLEKLESEAWDYAKIRMSHSPKDAGKMVESKFCNTVFLFEPDEYDVKEQYILYKSLSKLERVTIKALSQQIS